MPLVMEGEPLAPRKSTLSSFLSFNFIYSEGIIMPPAFEPPPTQAIIISG